MTHHDADVQTPESEEEEQARLPSPDADQRRKKDPEPAKKTRPAAFGGARRLEVRPVSRERPERESGGAYCFSSFGSDFPS